MKSYKSLLLILLVFLLLTVFSAVSGAQQNIFARPFDLPAAPSQTDPYEPNDSIELATPLEYVVLWAEIGAHGDVEYYEDIDFYRFAGQTGDEIVVDVTGYDNLSPWLFIRDSEGNIIDDQGSWPGDSVALQLTLTATSDYYLELQGDCHEGGAGCDGSYLLSLNLIDPYEPNDSLSASRLIAINSSLRAALDDHDEVPFWDDLDYYRFVSPEESTVVVDIEALGNNLDPDCALKDGAGAVLVSDIELGETCHLEYDVPADMLFYIEVSAFCGEGGADCQGVYSLTLAHKNEQPTCVQEDYELYAAETLAVAAPGVLANDTDPDGDNLTAVLATDVQHGDLDLQADGSFTYTPSTGYTGSDKFQYQAFDGILKSDPIAVNLEVNKREIFLPITAGVWQ